MPDTLPPDQKKIRDRLVRQHIGKRPNVGAQIDGCAALLDACASALGQMIGSVAVRAVFSRSLALARRSNPRLGGVVPNEDGLDLSQLRVDLQGKRPEVSREVLVTLLDELLHVLHALLGNALLPVLREVESQLAAAEPSAHTCHQPDV